jgi:hypothetical protein
MVIYKICVFGADRKSNMATRAHNVFWLVEILKIFLLETTKPIELWLCYKKSLGGRNWWNKLDFTPRYLCRCIDQLPKAVYDKNKRIKLYWLNGEVRQKYDTNVWEWSHALGEGMDFQAKEWSDWTYRM